MPTSHSLAAQLTICRTYLAQSLGHVPEVLKLVREIDDTLKAARESAESHGVVCTPAGVPLIDVAICGDLVRLSTPLSHGLMARHSDELLARLLAGVDVQVRVTK